MKVKHIALISVFIAGVTLLTMGSSINIFQGYLNFGDVLVMGMGFVLGLPYALLGGVGAALADLLLGYGQYAIFTLIIKGIEAGIIAYIAVKLGKAQLWVYLLAGTWMAVGYGLTDVLLTGELTIFIASFSYNIVQGIVCGGLAFALQPVLIRLKKIYSV
jgi:uncharacterized membrane protein